MLDFHQGAARLDVAAAFRQFFPSHCLDDWPVLPNELRRILKVLSLHFDTAGLPASATRYLEIERINRGLRIFPMRLNIPAHAVSPLYCVELGHLRFANLPFVRRECGVGRSDAPPVTQGTPLMRFGVWRREFDKPIPLAGGRKLVTLHNVTALPKKESALPEWQTAIEALMLVVEHGGPTMFARIGIMRALNRGHVREFNSSRKESHWGHRKLKRDE